MMQPLRAAPSPLLVGCLVGGAAIALLGCAEAPPPLASSAAEPPPPSLYGAAGAGTSPVDSEMLAMGKAEEEIDRALPGAGKDKERGSRRAPSKGASQSAPSPGVPSQNAPSQDPHAQKDDKSPSAPESPMGSADGDGCATACRALASMARSAQHLCSLAGDGDGRCDDARGRLRGASARVHVACPTCAAQP